MDVPILIWILAAALAVPLLLTGLLAFVSYRSIMGMATGDMRMDLLDHEHLIAIAEDLPPIDEWASAHGFEWLGAYRVDIPDNLPGTMTIWKRPGEGITLLNYKVGTASVTEFVTGFANDRTLTTTNLAQVLFPPMPEDPVQIGPDLSLDQLWSKHEEGSRFLHGRGWRKFNDPRPIEELVLSSARKRAQFIRTHTAWPIRMVWWFLTKSRRGRIPLTQQRLADFGNLV